MESSKSVDTQPEFSASEKWVLKMIKNKKKIYFGLSLFLILSVVFSALLFFRSKLLSNALSNTAQIQINPHIQKDRLKKLKKLVDHQKSLQPKLDAPLAQLFLNQKNFNHASYHLKRVYNRQNTSLAFVSQCNEVSILIERHQYKKALEKAHELETSLKERPKLASLYAYHLSQVYFLEKKMGYKEKSDATLKKLTQLTQNHLTAEAFQVGQLNLMTFLLESKKPKSRSDTTKIVN